MANSLSNIMAKILARGLLALREQARMCRLVNSDYANEAKEKGDTIDIPIPSAIATRDVTPAATPPGAEDVTPTKVQVSLNNWKEAPFKMSDKDMVEVDRNKHFIPMQVSEAIRSLANDINLSVLNQYKGVYGYVGTAGTTPFGDDVRTRSAIDARKVLNRQRCPRDNRRGVLDFDAEASALALKEFQDAEKVGSNTVKIEGEIGRKFGVDWYTDDQVVTHEAGTFTGITVNGANDAGATSIVVAAQATTGELDAAEGDIITIAGQDQTYVVTAAVTAAAGATATLAISPALQEATLGGEVITVKASHVVNLAFHRDAFALAMRPLVAETMDLQLGNQILSMPDPQTGLVLRLEISRQHKQTEWSFDALWGAGLVRAALAARIAG